MQWAIQIPDKMCSYKNLGHSPYSLKTKPLYKTEINLINLTFLIAKRCLGRRLG